MGISQKNMNKYEKLIEHILNDDQRAAKKLFHTIIVEKSRDIYEDLESEDRSSSTIGNDLEELDYEETGENLEELDDEELDDEDELEDIEDRVLDLEDALDDLRAEFKQLSTEDDKLDDDLDDDYLDDDYLDDDDDLDDDDLDDDDLDDEDDDDLDDEDEDDEDDEDLDDEDDEDLDDDDLDDEEDSSLYESGRRKRKIREYIERVESQENREGTQVGARGNSKIGINKNSLKFEKNDMGGTAKNISRGGSNAVADGSKAYAAPSNEYTRGRGKLADDRTYANANVPGHGKKLRDVNKMENSDGRPAGAKNSMGGTQNRRSIGNGRK